MGTYRINTYGCQMNIHESEKIAGMLNNMGYSPIDNANDADVIVFNTCCIRDNAEKKILGHIGQLKAIKERNPQVIVAIVGCMTQQSDSADKLLHRFPLIDIILGTANIHTLPNAISETLSNRKQKIISIDNNQKPNIVEFEGAYRTSGCNAWVNIMYGCNNFCTYCVVPLVRGRERSRQPGLIINEVKGLLDSGYKEITLLGQNVNSYGNDLNIDGINFAYLLAELGKIDGKHRIRFMTSHPKDLNTEVIDVIAKYSTICNYIHLPIQSGSNKVLSAMNRHYTSEYYIELIKMIKSKIPDCGITTDIMVGFPNEDEDDFQQTINIIRTVEFSAAFTYIYSPRKGTPAAEMEQIPYKIKSDRIQRLIKIQNDTTKSLSHKYYGNIYEVLCEDVKGDGLVCGRTDFGRLVTFSGDKSMIGKFYMVRINKSQSAALYGEIV